MAAVIDTTEPTVLEFPLAHTPIQRACITFDTLLLLARRFGLEKLALSDEAFDGAPRPTAGTVEYLEEFGAVGEMRAWLRAAGWTPPAGTAAVIAIAPADERERTRELGMEQGKNFCQSQITT